MAQEKSGSGHIGTMVSSMRSPDDVRAQGDRIQFEPANISVDIFRNDIVFLMRHGPTDWSHRDAYNVEPTDCENQRIQSPEGEIDMQNFGILLADNGVRPAKIVVSEWCRNQQTLENMITGFSLVDAAWTDTIEIETDPELNLLLSLQGAANVTSLRNRISNWTGEGANGPLLLISHFTNIQELTQFNTFEGEILIIDPKRNNRVLGYLRLGTSEPDEGHFDVEGTSQ